MSEATSTKKAKSFTKKTPEELVKEFGSVRLRRIAEASFPSDDAIAKVDAMRKELEDLRKELENVPEKFRNLAQKAVDGAEFKLHVAQSNLGNPNNISEFDRALIDSAARRILKAKKANFVTVARFVLENINVFPVAGTKY